ncbi:MAG: hypothetical protein U0Z44_01645 [Kouleothrix sp.]
MLFLIVLGLLSVSSSFKNIGQLRVERLRTLLRVYFCAAVRATRQPGDRREHPCLGGREPIEHEA